MGSKLPTFVPVLQRLVYFIYVSVLWDVIYDHIIKHLLQPPWTTCDDFLHLSKVNKRAVACTAVSQHRPAAHRTFQGLETLIFCNTAGATRKKRKERKVKICLGERVVLCPTTFVVGALLPVNRQVAVIAF